MDISDEEKSAESCSNRERVSSTTHEVRGSSYRYRRQRIFVAAWERETTEEDPSESVKERR